MSANSMQLQERQVLNIVDGKCLGNLKDIELNLWTGSIQALVLPGGNGFWNRLQKTEEVIIPWEKVVLIGVDVILVDLPECAQYDTLIGPGKRRKQDRKEKAKSREIEKVKGSEKDGTWQQEDTAYEETLNSANQQIIVLNPEEYREV